MSDHWNSIANLLGTPSINPIAKKPTQPKPPKSVTEGTTAAIAATSEETVPVVDEAISSEPVVASEKPDAISRIRSSWDSVARMFGVSAPDPTLETLLSQGVTQTSTSEPVVGKGSSLDHASHDESFGGSAKKQVLKKSDPRIEAKTPPKKRKPSFWESEETSESDSSTPEVESQSDSHFQGTLDQPSDPIEDEFVFGKPASRRGSPRREDDSDRSRRPPVSNDDKESGVVPERRGRPRTIRRGQGDATSTPTSSDTRQPEDQVRNQRDRDTTREADRSRGGRGRDRGERETTDRSQSERPISDRPTSERASSDRSEQEPRRDGRRPRAERTERPDRDASVRDASVRDDEARTPPEDRNRTSSRNSGRDRAEAGSESTSNRGSDRPSNRESTDDREPRKRARPRESDDRDSARARPQSKSVSRSSWDSEELLGDSPILDVEHVEIDDLDTDSELIDSTDNESDPVARKRRRRRRGGRKSESGEQSDERSDIRSESRSDGPSDGRGRQAYGRDAEEEIDSDEIDLSISTKSIKVTSWTDAIMPMIESNMENHKRAPSRDQRGNRDNRGDNRGGNRGRRF